MAINFPASPTTGDTHAASGKNWEFNGTGWVLQVADPAAVTSVNGATGIVVLAASDVGAEPTIAAGTTAQYRRGDKTWRDLATDVRAAVLTGLSTATSAVIAATDTVIGALGKIQAQVTDNLLPKGYIDGLQMQWVSGTALTVTSGAAYIEGSSKVLRATSAIAKTSLSLTASTWYHVYLYDNAGTPAVEVVTTAPASPYNGTARSKTGDTSRRYVGSVRTDSSGSLYKFAQQGLTINWYADLSYQPGAFRILSNGTSTTRTTVDCSAVVPSTSRSLRARFLNLSTSSAARFDNADTGNTGTGTTAQAILSLPSGGTSAFLDFPVSAAQTLSYLMVSSSTDGAYVDSLAYTYER